MTLKFLSLLAGAALVTSVSFANAAEPVHLTEVQLDAITAAGDNTIYQEANVFNAAYDNYVKDDLNQKIEKVKIIQVAVIVDNDGGKDKGHRGHRGHKR